MNTYTKYCPNVFLAKCAESHAKGSIIEVVSQYDKAAACEVHNLVMQSQGFYYYSITRCDGLNQQSYAEQKTAKYMAWAAKAVEKGGACFEQAQEGRAFLSLGEPIKVGHHSEGKHRALFARNHARMANGVALMDKAESHELKAAYWESMKDKIDLSMPESIEYFKNALVGAVAYQAGLKSGAIKREHSFSLAYATKEVKEIEKKIGLAIKLWGEQVV